MIRHLRIWIAARKLERLVRKQKAELERRQFAKRSSASKLGWQRRRTA
jgi:ribosome-associated translation inhibitor RaiA